MPCVSRQRAHSNMDKVLSYAQSAVQARLCMAGPSQATTKSVDSRSCEWGATVCCAGMRTAVPTGRAWCCCLVARATQDQGDATASFVVCGVANGPRRASKVRGKGNGTRLAARQTTPMGPLLW